MYPCYLQGLFRVARRFFLLFQQVSSCSSAWCPPLLPLLPPPPAAAIAAPLLLVSSRLLLLPPPPSLSLWPCRVCHLYCRLEALPRCHSLTELHACSLALAAARYAVTLCSTPLMPSTCSAGSSSQTTTRERHLRLLMPAWLLKGRDGLHFACCCAECPQCCVQWTHVQGLLRSRRDSSNSLPSCTC